MPFLGDMLVPWRITTSRKIKTYGCEQKLNFPGLPMQKYANMFFFLPVAFAIFPLANEQRKLRTMSINGVNAHFGSLYWMFCVFKTFWDNPTISLFFAHKHSNEFPTILSNKFVFAEWSWNCHLILWRKNFWWPNQCCFVEPFFLGCCWRERLRTSCAPGVCIGPHQQRSKAISALHQHQATSFEGAGIVLTRHPVDCSGISYTAYHHLTKKRCWETNVC